MAKSDLPEKIIDSRVAKHYKAAGTLTRDILNDHLDQLEDCADRSAPILATMDSDEDENTDMGEQTEEVPASTAGDEPAESTDSVLAESSLLSEDSTTDNG